MAEDRKEMMDDDMELDLEDMDDMQEEPSLFWSLKVPAGGQVSIDAPPMMDYIVRCTKACYGTTMKNKSRSVLTCQCGDGDDIEFVPVCVLNSTHCENVILDLLFNESATFKVEGRNPSDIFLSGYYQPGNDVNSTPMPFDDRAAMGLTDNGMPFDMMDDEDVEIDDKQDDIAPELIDESEEQPNANAQKKRKLNDGNAKTTANGKVNNKNKRKSPINKPVSNEDEPNKNNNNNKNNKNDKKNKKNKNKKAGKQQEAVAQTNKQEAPASAAEATATQDKDQESSKKKKKQKGKRKKLPQGLEYKDSKVGSGATIKKGDTVSVFYIGQLQSNSKIFDKSLSGSGFSFTVGAGEVIKGWDMGLVGMKGVGSKRKLWIPAKLAYANEAQNGIPANSDLMFTVEVKKVE